MKRTARSAFFAAATVAAGLGAFGRQLNAQDAPQVDPVEGLVAAIRAAERAASTVIVELETAGELPGGLKVQTQGTLRVLRATQSDLPNYLHTALTYDFGDGVRGTVESNRTQNGIEIYEDSPAFGEVYVHLAQAIVVDLEWAGEVLERSDLPGMADRRADAPLGSDLLAGLHKRFALTLEAGKRGEDAGVWLRGPRRAQANDLDPALPRADRVEVFVRDRDKAVVEMLQRQGDKVVQRVTVQKLELGKPLQVADLRVDGRGQKVREVQQYLPLWEQIEEVLGKAESKAGGDVVRPSRRK